jgi:hypothetical protein
MKINNHVKRFLPAGIAFIMVGLGAYIGLSHASSANAKEHLVPTLMLKVAHSAGTQWDVVRADAQVKMIPDTSRADGALSSLDEIPKGVLAYPHVSGQQLLSSSFAPDVVQALGANYVALSVRVDPQRWVGPLMASGNIVNVFDVEGVDAMQVATKAVILKTPDTAALDPKEGVVISLAVLRESVPKVLAAAENEHLWLVGV